MDTNLAKKPFHPVFYSRSFVSIRGLKILAATREDFWDAARAGVCSDPAAAGSVAPRSQATFARRSATVADRRCHRY